MGHPALEHNRNYFHFFMRMLRKPSSRLNYIIIEDPQCSELNILWIIIVGK